MVFGLMAGKFPQKVICMWCRHKSGWVGLIRQKWVRMGAAGYISKGTAQNNEKIYMNANVGQYLVTHIHGNKIRLTLVWQKNRLESIIRIILGI